MTTDDRLLSGAASESSLPPNKSSGDIVERLRLNACRLSHESMDAFHMRRIRVELEAATKIERLGREVVEARSLHRHQRDKRRHAHTARNKAIDGFEYWRARALIAESAVAAAWEEAIKCVPTNWLDNLLTGPDAPRGPLGNPDVEKLLLGIINRMKARASAIRAAGAGKTAESGHSPSTSRP